MHTHTHPRTCTFIYSISCSFLIILNGLLVGGLKLFLNFRTHRTQNIVVKKMKVSPEWSLQEEIKLFQAVRHNKPVGVNKHFAIIKIIDQLNGTFDRNVTIPQLWSYLKTLYNIDALDEFETPPFPNEQVEFSLPPEIPLPADYAETMSEVGSESDTTRQSVADSVELDQTSEVPNKSSRRTSERSNIEDNTPKRPPKRTRAASQNLETPPNSAKRRRV